MKIGNHIVASVGVSAVFYGYTKSVMGALMVFASGVFIDLDHFLDYFISEKRIKLDVADFFRKCEGHLLKNSYLIFHSYELVFFLWAAAVFFNDIYVKAVATGVTVHILMDALYKINRYPSKPLAYSFLYRALIMKFKSMPGCSQ